MLVQEHITLVLMVLLSSLFVVLTSLLELLLLATASIRVCSFRSGLVVLRLRLSKILSVGLATCRGRGGWWVAVIFGRWSRSSVAVAWVSGWRGSWSGLVLVVAVVIYDSSVTMILATAFNVGTYRVQPWRYHPRRDRPHLPRACCVCHDPSSHPPSFPA